MKRRTRHLAQYVFGVYAYNRGCRCRVCTDAMSLYQSDRRDKIFAKTGRREWMIPIDKVKK